MKSKHLPNNPQEYELIVLFFYFFQIITHVKKDICFKQWCQIRFHVTIVQAMLQDSFLREFTSKSGATAPFVLK